MVASDIKFVVKLLTEQTEDGKFRPWVSVIRQEGSHFNTMTLDLEDDTLFIAEGAALEYAKDRVTKLLRKQSVKAEIRFSSKRKVA